ncbi:hypothetical protein GOP47_0029489 [Adiantum capillus-veneris]|nr:hypothetical protein GOP47_0029489 [Adiantum capillus-veneris]
MDMNDSVLVDLIKYAKHLEQRIEETQNDIARLQSEEFAGVNISTSCSTSSEAPDESASPSYKLLELNVSRLTEHEFHLKISCRKSSGVSLQLVRALEALHLNISNANVVSVGESALNADFVFKTTDDNCSLRLCDLEDKIVRHVNMFGLQF